MCTGVPQRYTLEPSIGTCNPQRYRVWDNPGMGPGRRIWVSTDTGRSRRRYRLKRCQEELAQPNTPSKERKGGLKKREEGGAC
ncbi:unnamed protein product [Lota lota]